MIAYKSLNFLNYSIYFEDKNYLGIFFGQIKLILL
jgi:hypothetical protein